MQNKRGQVEWGTLIPGIIAVIVLVVVVIGIFWFVNRTEGVGENIPKNIEVIRTACETSATESFKETYCNQIREIGKNKYVTCTYAKAFESVDIEGSDQMVSVCNAQIPTYEKRIKQQCDDLKLKATALVDGKKCEVWTVNACTKLKDEEGILLNAKWVVGVEDTTTTVTGDLICPNKGVNQTKADNYNKPGADYLCCSPAPAPQS